jgi:hypothetical protein
MVFAARVVEGIKNEEQCPPLAAEQKAALTAYLGRFTFDL